jgi:hypothetical protein
LQDIPHGFYLVGCSAYTLSSSLLVPYTGSDKKVPENEVFNFHLSQLQKKIEQAFGFLVNKWRILMKPIEINLRWVPLLIKCQLHNYCINEREKEWFISDIPHEAIRDHCSSYEEYLDELDNDEQQQTRGHVNIRS